LATTYSVDETKQCIVAYVICFV